MSSVVGGAVGGVAAAVAVTVVVVVLAVLRKRRVDKGCISFNIQPLTYMFTISTVVYFKYFTTQHYYLDIHLFNSIVL